MKFKLSILAKVAILGTLASVIAGSISIAVSYTNTVNTAKQNQIDTIDNTLEGIYTNFFGTSESNQNLLNLKTVVDKAEEYYEGGLKDISPSDFATYEEYQNYVKNEAVFFYPKPNSMIGSPAYFDFRSKYEDLLNFIQVCYYTTRASAVYAAYYDNDTNRYVFIADNRTTTGYDEKSAFDFYNVVCSYYDIKGNEITESDKSGYPSFRYNGLLTNFVDIYDDDPDNLLNVRFFIEYNPDLIAESLVNLLNSEIVVISLTSAFIILMIIVGSYFLFIRNVNKLKIASNEITNNLGKGEEFKTVDINVKSHDEIKNLANSFVTMEEEIKNYIDLITQNTKEKEKANAELSIASKIQLESLPAASFSDANTHLEAFIQPAKEVGGDFYDYFYVGDKLVILLADVSGKGIPASLFMMRGKELIKANLLYSEKSLAEIVEDVNNQLGENNDENLFITSFIGVIDFNKHILRCVNAGHEKPYIIRKNEVKQLDCSSNFVLGGVSNITFKEEIFEFNDGDCIFLFTDGLNESINSKNEEFGYGNIQKSLQNSINFGLKEKIDYMLESLKSFAGNGEQFDDITILVCEANSNDLHLEYNKKDYSIISDIMENIKNKYSFAEKNAFSKLGIIIDELVNNLISYEKVEDLRIKIDLSLNNNEFDLIISCNGNDFNPFGLDGIAAASEEPDEVGGFGILMVKSIAKSTSYRYKNGESITELVIENK